ncbi:MAG: septum formation initiator family protein [Spirochaetaceae bacterium]|nr:septum formation initiator family protein [Spirochaetaceae bacterium]
MSSSFLHRARVSLYAGIACYCILSVVAGPSGIIAQRELETRKVAMELRLKELAGANERLHGEFEALRSDPDRLGREARELGYLRSGEVAIVLAGRSAAAESRLPTQGEIVPFIAPSSLPDAGIKQISLALTLAVLALGLAADVRRAPLQRKSRVQTASRT